jgi:hypothetical protein
MAPILLPHADIQEIYMTQKHSKASSEWKGLNESDQTKQIHCCTEYQHCPNNVHIYSLLDGVNISSNLTAENPVSHKLVGRLDDPSLAVPLSEPARRRSNLKIL